MRSLYAYHRRRIWYGHCASVSHVFQFLADLREIYQPSIDMARGWPPFTVTVHLKWQVSSLKCQVSSVTCQVSVMCGSNLHWPPIKACESYKGSLHVYKMKIPEMSGVAPSFAAMGQSVWNVNLRAPFWFWDVWRKFKFEKNVGRKWKICAPPEYNHWLSHEIPKISTRL
jgi:hypothetical protein